MSYQHTHQWVVDMSVDTAGLEEQVAEAARLIQLNQLVAFPTETVYGLGANALSDEAVSKIFSAKGRPADNPLIIHIAEKQELEKFVKAVPPKAKAFMDAFWPGPLAIVLEHNGTASEFVTAGLSTVAVRMPDHPVALALIKAAGLPLAAPSANSSGKPSPTLAAHVHEDLNNKISGILNGGPTGVGVESTVIDCTEDSVTILRPGGITKEALEKVAGPVFMDPALEKADDSVPVSPGMKYTHYAPSVPLYLIDGNEEDFKSAVAAARKEQKRIGLLLTDEYSHLTDCDQQVLMGSVNDLPAVARGLYGALRSFRTEDVDVIYAQMLPETELGNAIMNRLKKAAGGRIIRGSN